MALNEGLFEDNGRCGYVLKPEFMRSSDSGFGQDLPAPSDWLRRLTLTVISGHMLPKRPGDSNTTILDPYVQVFFSSAFLDFLYSYLTKQCQS